MSGQDSVLGWPSNLVLTHTPRVDPALSSNPLPPHPTDLPWGLEVSILGSKQPSSGTESPNEHKPGREALLPRSRSLS